MGNMGFLCAFKSCGRFNQLSIIAQFTRKLIRYFRCIHFVFCIFIRIGRLAIVRINIALHLKSFFFCFRQISHHVRSNWLANSSVNAVIIRHFVCVCAFSPFRIKCEICIKQTKAKRRNKKKNKWLAHHRLIIDSVCVFFFVSLCLFGSSSDFFFFFCFRTCSFNSFSFVLHIALYNNTHNIPFLWFIVSVFLYFYF